MLCAMLRGSNEGEAIAHNPAAHGVVLERGESALVEATWRIIRYFGFRVDCGIYPVLGAEE